MICWAGSLGRLVLEQTWANYGPRATYGPLGFLIRPAELVQIIVKTSFFPLSLQCPRFPNRWRTQNTLTVVGVARISLYFTLIFTSFHVTIKPFCENERTKEKESGQRMPSV